MSKVAKVHTIEYETQNIKGVMNWKATIIAYTMEDAIALIKRRVKEFSKVTSLSTERNIDAITQDIIDDIVKFNVPKAPEKEDKEVPARVVEIVPETDVPEKGVVESDTKDTPKVSTSKTKAK